MIEPGKNGAPKRKRRKGRCEAGHFAKNGRPLDMDTSAHYRDGRPALADALEANGEGIPER